MTDAPKFKIRDLLNGNFVSSITPSGISVADFTGRIFESYGQAVDFLSTSQRVCFSNNVFLNIQKFIIEEFRLIPYSKHQVFDTTESNIINGTQNYTLEVSVLLKICVKDGFNSISQSLFNFILTSDKYKPIIEQIVPPHILQCKEDFMDVGILTCDIDILGSISLTASNEQLTMHDIDGVLKART